MVEVKKYKYETIPGFTHGTDFDFLRKVCEGAPDSGIIVELGSFLGKSAVFFAETMRELGKQYEIYALDRYWARNKKIIQNLDFIEGDVDSLISFMSELDTRPHERTPMASHHLKLWIELAKKFCSDFPEITLIKHDIFKPIPKQLHNKKITIVFEDSEHSYNSTIRCLENYFPRLESNGIFCGDDYNWPEVSRAVKDYAKKNNLQVHTDNKIWRLE